MVDGVLKLPQAVLTAETVVAVEQRMITDATVSMVARRVGLDLLKPKLTKFIPYVGWGFAIASALYVAYEVYNSTQVDWAKLEGGRYEPSDLAVFRMGFTQARNAFLATAVGQAMARQRQKYILIPSEVMPAVASVDTQGIMKYTNRLIWDPANKASRRYAATNRLGRAGNFVYQNGQSVRGSWEEYPFASTRKVSTVAGVHTGAVPLRENWIQGGFIRAAAMVQNFMPNDPVSAFIL